MKKCFIGLMVLALSLICPYLVDAKHDKYNGGPGKSYAAPGHRKIRNDARYIIHRSAEVVFTAQRAADRGRRYRGLALAVAHQRKARELYFEGFYREAIYHSLRAREIAFDVIAANREKPRREYYHDEIEVGYRQSAPRGKELDISISTVKIGKDNEVVHFRFGLDITQ